MTTDEELLRLAARGSLAGAVTAELAAPLERVARALEGTVDRLDRHVASSRGPEPLPYAALGQLREQVAEAFLELSRLARLAADLTVVAASPSRAAVDLNDLVERALSFARHRFDPDCDVQLDLGSLPLVEVDAVRMVQALAHLLIEAALAAGAAASVTVNTEARSGAIRLEVAYPGARPAGAPFADMVLADLAADGGQLTYTTDGERTVAVLVLPARK